MSGPSEPPQIANERTRLTATALSNLGVALVVVGFITRPSAARSTWQVGLCWGRPGVGLAWSIVGAGLHGIARILSEN